MFASSKHLVAALYEPAVRLLVTGHYRNTVQAVGFPDGHPEQMSRDQLASGVSRIFSWLVTQATHGTKKLDLAIQQAEGFRAHVATFADRGELRSIQAWLGRFGQDLRDESPALGEMAEHLGPPAREWIDGFSEAQLLTLALSVSRHAKLGLSRAAVFVKLLCEDVELFEDYAGPGGPQELFVPPDRTNLSVVSYLLMHNSDFGRIFPKVVLKRVRKHPRSDESFFRLSFLANRLLSKRAIVLEDLWLIGRYYHDSVTRTEGIVRAEGRAPCTVNRDLAAQDELLFTGVEVPDVCPLKALGCVYQGKDLDSEQSSARQMSPRKKGRPHNKSRGPGGMRQGRR